MKKKTISADSLHNLLCYTAGELRRYNKEGISPDDGQHLQTCSRCRDLYLRLANAPAPDHTRLARELPGQGKFQPEKRAPRKSSPWNGSIETGQLWKTLPTSKTTTGQNAVTVSAGRPVAILWPGNGNKELANIIRVAPITWDTDYYRQGEDILLDEKNSPLGYPIMIELWNERLMLAGNLGDYLGVLGKNTIKEIVRIQKSAAPKRKAVSKDVQSWRATERDMTDYLDLPVNLSLQEQASKVNLYEYCEAADDKGMDLAYVNPTPLLETDRYALFIVQVRDRMMLRLLCDELKSQVISVDGEIIRMTRTAGNNFEAAIGTVGSVPAEIVLKMTILSDPFNLKIGFIKKNGRK